MNESCGQTWLENFMLLLVNVFFVFDIFTTCMQMTNFIPKKEEDMDFTSILY
jgi:hypothetical protein